MRKVLSTIAAMALLATTMIGGAAVSAADETNIKDVTVLRRTPLITELNTIAQSLKEGETSTLFEIEAGGERGDYFPYGEGTEPVFQLYGGSYQGKNTVSVEPSKSSLFSPLMFKVDSTIALYIRFDLPLLLTGVLSLLYIVLDFSLRRFENTHSPFLRAETQESDRA